jgi:MinD-like ATPase involved in chromosome partitioning or flagellar assembly
VGDQRGVGTTTIAINSAAWLGCGDERNRQVLLVDASDNQRGVLQYLGLEPGRNHSQMIQAWLEKDSLDPQDVQNNISRYIPHTQSQNPVLDILVLPSTSLSASDKDRLRSYRAYEFVSAMCHAARDTGYDFLIADLGAFPLNELTTELLRQAHWIGLIGNDMPSIQAQPKKWNPQIITGTIASVVRLDHLPPERLADLANDRHPKLQSHCIPWVKESLWRNELSPRIPFVLADKSSEFAKAIFDLAQSWLP